jgi:polysaccharide export outer membrane protein
MTRSKFMLRIPLLAAAVFTLQAQTAFSPRTSKPPGVNVPPTAELPRTGADRGAYRIGPGDVLQISVWKEPEVSVPSVVVRTDGKIAVPLLKEIQVVGLTPLEAEKVIADGLSKYLMAVDVTLVVREMHGRKAYVLGAVKKEGPVILDYQMTVLQALTEAGGLTEFAKRKKIYVLRSEAGRQSRLPFNYQSVIAGKHMEQNVYVIPGDTIVVPH